MTKTLFDLTRSPTDVTMKDILPVRESIDLLAKLTDQKVMRVAPYRHHPSSEISYLIDFGCENFQGIYTASTGLTEYVKHGLPQPIKEASEETNYCLV